MARSGRAAGTSSAMADPILCPTTTKGLADVVHDRPNIGREAVVVERPLGIATCAAAGAPP
jgi:hypothetical protein